MKTPTRKEAEDLGRQFGEFAGMSNTGLMLFELDAIGIQNMIDVWIDRQTPAPPLPARKPAVTAWRKRQVEGEA